MVQILGRGSSGLLLTIHNIALAQCHLLPPNISPKNCSTKPACWFGSALPSVLTHAMDPGTGAGSMCNTACKSYLYKTYSIKLFYSHDSWWFFYIVTFVFSHGYDSLLKEDQETKV